MPKAKAKTFECSVLEPEECKKVQVPFAAIADPVCGVRSVIAEHGYCIVSGILADEECTQLEGSLLEDLNELVDEDAMKECPERIQEAWAQAQEGVGLWPSATLRRFGIKGRFQLHGLTHGRFAWGCRIHPKVRKVYEELHLTDDLVSNCDNSFVSNYAASEETSNQVWPHADMNLHDPLLGKWAPSDRQVYQGLLYLWSSEAPRSSTTVLWPQSHLPAVYGKYMNEPKYIKNGREEGKHFCQIARMTKGSDKEALMQGWLAEARRIPVPAGGLLLWDSRTTHQGWSGGPRLAQPVCWEPRERRDRQARIRKLAISALGLPSTHFASLGMPHYLTGQNAPKPVEGRDGGTMDEVLFPLKATIRSQAVRPEIEDMEMLWSELGHLRLDDLPKGKVQYLESIVSDEFKKIL